MIVHPSCMLACHDYSMELSQTQQTNYSGALMMSSNDGKFGLDGVVGATTPPKTALCY